MDFALLAARLFIGLGMAAHGVQKLFGWYGGYGLTATGEFMVKLGFPSARIFGTAAALGETLGGLLVALGLFGPVGPAIVIAVMITASVTVHGRNGFFATNNGYELPMLYAFAVLVLAFAGPGQYSLDRMLGLPWIWSDALTWQILAAGVVVAGINTVLARPRQPAGSSH